MNKQIIAALTTMSFTLAATTAHAAMVQPGTGQTMVNQGSGYKTITNPMELGRGDKVLVSPGGTAKIYYSDGCSVPIKIGSVATIGAQSPCALNGTLTSVQEVSQGGMVQTQAAGGAAGTTTGTATGGGAAGAGAGTATAAGGAGGAAAAGAAAGTIGGIGLGTIGLVGLGVAAVAGVAAAVSAASKDDDKASP